MNQNDKIKNLFAEYVAAQKEAENAGVPEAHFKRALAASILTALNAGYKIGDLDCFQNAAKRRLKAA
ncbi:MAG: hypothetical protein HAW59_05915 [Betaproteobacteria bacterium]|nr:hypothetical protein [Betaproteobacteria bacterium]